MKKHLFLIGMMGCGKSTMAAGLSRILQAEACDLDEEIVRLNRKSIPEIFRESGDDGFRVCETAALREICGRNPMIVATGGGIIKREENVRLMKEHGLVVWLNRPLEDMIRDVRQDTRPNLTGNKEERMRTLFAERESLYRAAADLEFCNSAAPLFSSKELAAHPLVRSLL